MQTDSTHTERNIEFARRELKFGSTIPRVAGKLSNRVTPGTEFHEVMQLANEAQKRHHSNVGNAVADAGPSGIRYGALREELYPKTELSDESGLKKTLKILYESGTIETSESTPEDSITITAETTVTHTDPHTQSGDTHNHRTNQDNKSDTEAQQGSSEKDDLSSHKDTSPLGIGNQKRKGKSSWSADTK